MAISCTASKVNRASDTMATLVHPSTLNYVIGSIAIGPMIFIFFIKHWITDRIQDLAILYRGVGDGKRTNV